MSAWSFLSRRRSSTDEANKRGDEYTVITDDPSSSHNSSNYVSTRRYSWLTFLPLSLVYQFRSVSNCYFFIVAILVFSIENPPLTPITTLLPLLFVLAVSEIRELVEEISASRRDAVMNNERVSLLKGPRKARELRPGDLVLVKKNEPVRADIVLLVTASPGAGATGVPIWIETSSLDGETNLKLKKSVNMTADREFTNLTNLVIKCRQPSVDMYEFVGTIEDPVSGEIEQLDLSNVAWRGSVLRNTEWIIGVVVYVGKETKMMMNLSALSLIPSKRTKLDREMDSIVAKIIILQIVLCLIPIFFIPDVSESLRPWWKIFTNGSSRFWIFFILLDNLIPVSLWVVSDMIKIAQAKVIDSGLGDDVGISCNSKNLHDELGRVTHVLTDKTGTLTVNRMKFIGCSIRDFVSDATGESVESESRLVFDSVLAPSIDLVRQVREATKIDCDLFLLTLSLCHSCERVQEAITGRWLNQSNSPDEACLVSFAADCGYVFEGRRKDTIILEVNGGRVEYEILHTIPFTSDRKRMTIVVRNRSNLDEIFVLSKGADSVVIPLCVDGEIDVTNGVVERFSMTGYRTLCIAAKRMSCEEWNRLSGAKESQKIESGLTLVGSTAVEDRLQDGVDMVLRSLRAAGIKVCMITGDKRETAVNIAVKCGLISSVNHVQIIETSCGQFRLSRFIPKRATQDGTSTIGCQDHKITGGVTSRGDSLSAVVEGDTLEVILESVEMSQRLCDLLTSCWFESVIFCRVSPKQKGDIVQLINRNGTRPGSGGILGFMSGLIGWGNWNDEYSTLAIGDGANDVNMIKVANVGVGISGGLEGSQAANSSDYTVSQFKDLYTLLFVHGRWNLRRMKLFVGLSIFKNFCFVFTQYWFATISQFSGVSAYDAIYLMIYNTVLGVLPLMILGLFERDFDLRDLKVPPQSFSLIYESVVPKCYRDQIERLRCELSKWAAVGFISSVVVFYPTWYSLYMSKAAIDSSGRMHDVWMGSGVMYTAEVVVCSGLILAVSQTWNWLVIFGVAGTYIALYFGLAWAYDSLIGETKNGMSPIWFYQGQFWLILCLIFGAVFIPIFGVKIFANRMQSPPCTMIAGKIHKYNKVNNSFRSV